MIRVIGWPLNVRKQGGNSSDRSKWGWTDVDYLGPMPIIVIEETENRYV